MSARLRILLIEVRGYLIAFALVTAATVVFFPGRAHFAKGQWALLYLLIIVFVAGLSGVRPAILASGLSFLCWNYFFLPPYHTFRIYDPKDWLALTVFLVVGIVMGLQTGKLREREAQALARERDTALLNRFSAHLVSELGVSEMASILARELAANTKASCMTLFGLNESNRLSVIQPSDGPVCIVSEEEREMVEWSYREAKAVGLSETERHSKARPEGWPVSASYAEAGFEDTRGDLVIPLLTATKQVGVLYVGQPVDERRYTTAQARIFVAIANQAAAFLERKQLHDIAVQADALREADRLKSTFVSSVSHELKTPLASLTATVTNLLESDLAWNENTVRDELKSVGDDLERLNDSISSLVDLSRLESAAWTPHKDWYELGEILGTTLTKIPARQRGRVLFAIPEDLPSVYVDFDQMSRVLRNLLENALTYSNVDLSVSVGASANPREFKMWVEDQGPGIPADERTKVFDKFYRGRHSIKSPSGTGLGLAVAQEIVKSHGGSMWIEDVTPHGARVVVSIQRTES